MELEMEIKKYKRLAWRKSSGRSEHVKCNNCDNIIPADATYLDLTGMFGGNNRLCANCYLSFIIKTKPEWLTEKCFTDLAADML